MDSCNSVDCILVILCGVRALHAIGLARLARFSLLWHTCLQGQPGLEIAQLLQQAAFSQQVQAQQGQLLQALQMQQLFHAAQQSAGKPHCHKFRPGLFHMEHVQRWCSCKSITWRDALAATSCHGLARGTFTEVLCSCAAQEC